MHIANVFYEDHKADIERIESMILEKNPELAKPQCADAKLDMGPMSDFVKSTTPSSLRAYITGVLMRSWISTQRNFNIPDSDSKTSEGIYRIGQMLSSVGSYTIIHSAAGEPALNAANEVISGEFRKLAEIIGARGLEIKKFTDGHETERQQFERDPPGDKQPPKRTRS